MYEMLVVRVTATNGRTGVLRQVHTTSTHKTTNGRERQGTLGYINKSANISDG